MFAQVTLFDPKGHYKPVSVLVTIDNVDELKTNRQNIAKEGIVKICQKRYWTQKDLKRFGYKECKVRLYQKEK